MLKEKNFKYALDLLNFVNQKNNTVMQYKVIVKGITQCNKCSEFHLFYETEEF